MSKINYVDKNGTFSIENPENYNYLYFPIASKKGLKSAVTPNLGGDIKIDQEGFLIEPVSSENLHNNRSTRNFWCRIENEGCWSAVGASAEAEFTKFTEQQDNSVLTAGLMWHSIKRTSAKYGLSAEVTSFVPLEDNVEIMSVKLCNTSNKAKKVTPFAAIPIYGRSADNLRDHRNVTSMLHRIRTEDCGVAVTPTMSFDEKGHRRNYRTYFVAGATAEGELPVAFYPTVDSFVGEGNTYTHPGAVYFGTEGVAAGTEIDGREATGAFRFETVTLLPGEEKEYTVIMGITESAEPLANLLAPYRTAKQVEDELSKVKDYWQKTVNVDYHTGSKEFDFFMRWVSFQPFLRRLYGCSFLPHHDYGRGGRGWRDLWQDCLSLLLMEPGDVRNMIVANYGGVRADGSNATIIGHKPGEFIADRNGISRVWMDHAVWPFITTKLYIDQTGDLAVLNEKASYFKDAHSKRGAAIDGEWNEQYGMKQKTEKGEAYEGTVLEHLLVQNLCSFYEVGEHNIMRLRGADWNDALDMADENGESVAFTCAYAGNFKQLAQTLRLYSEKTGVQETEVFEELSLLLEDDEKLYNDADKKRA
ncbi:MAG: cellobiose phosphorylase, partial [Ruminiclostridium sp.]|nr:cellobiose phosphorylase [Ruminiclostridium sp.]